MEPSAVLGIVFRVDWRFRVRHFDKAFVLGSLVFREFEFSIEENMTQPSGNRGSRRDECHTVRMRICFLSG